jgi:hypothetical protein
MNVFIDVSHYDAETIDGKHYAALDWPAQRAAGAKLAFMKCSEGMFSDPAFKLQWEAAGKAGMIRGAYCYFHPAVNAIRQAHLQIDLLNQAGMNFTGDPRTSDKIILDFECMDELLPEPAIRAAASWFFEVHQAFPQHEIIIYTGFFFWDPFTKTHTGVNWAKETSLWMASYPCDPVPKEKNPPLPFRTKEMADLTTKAFGKYATAIPIPWRKVTYRQITGWADSRDIPGHTALKKVVDVNVTLDYDDVDLPDLTTTPVPSTIPASVPLPQPGQEEKWRVQTSSWIFSTANDGVGCKILSRTAAKDVLTSLESDPDWTHLVDPIAGWVRTRFLRKLTKEELPEAGSKLIGLQKGDGPRQHGEGADQGLVTPAAEKPQGSEAEHGKKERRRRPAIEGARRKDLPPAG